MPVIGIDQVPREIVRPKWYSDLGYMQGYQANKLLDKITSALMGQMGGLGQVPTQPTPGNPGTLTFPSGATTNTSPQELAQLQALGGIPTQQGGITPFGQPATGGVSYQVPTTLGIRPNLDYQAKQADIAYKQAQTQSLSPEFQAELLRRYQGLSPGGTSPPQGSENDFLRGLADLSTKAQAGDEDAVRRIRMIRQLMQGS